MAQQKSNPLPIQDVVFDMYRPQVEQLITQNVQTNLARVLTMVHIMIVDELEKASPEQQQPFINILQRMQQTFMENGPPAQAQTTSNPQQPLSLV